MTTCRNLIALGVICLVAAAEHPESQAQDGISSASFSYAMSQRGSGSGRRYGMHRLELADVRVEEIVNYHRHTIPLPERGEPVRLDLRICKLNDNRAVLQAGLTTTRHAMEDARPLNLVVVIDRSGSMSGERIANVKKSLHALIDRLRNADRLTIVAFSDQAEVVRSGCRGTDREAIHAAIDRIDTSGSTNLHAGLMLGYAQAREHFANDRTSRLILLTDGIANVGTTDAEEISAQSRENNRRGIDLATIGLGRDFNEELLRTLAEAGRGLMHFVGDDRDIQKTFVRELESLLTPAVRRARLTLCTGHGTQITKLYGYQPEFADDRVHIALDDLNQGATQVVLATLPLPRGSAQIRATLDYVDAISGEPAKLTRSLTVGRELRDEDELADGDVRKNYVIARLAQAIHRSVVDTRNEDYRQAAASLTRAIDFASEQRCGDDDDVERVRALACDYRRQILAASQLDGDDRP